MTRKKYRNLPQRGEGLEVPAYLPACLDQFSPLTDNWEEGRKRMHQRLLIDKGRALRAKQLQQSFPHPHDQAIQMIQEEAEEWPPCKPALPHLC